jgi:RND superfamily putative drug exporter
MTALARWCFRHRLTVAGIWVVLLVAIAAPATMLGAGYDDSFHEPGMESTRAQDLLQASAPQQAGDVDQIVLRVRQGSVTDKTVRREVSTMLAKVAKLPAVAAVTSPYGPDGKAQLSPDQRIGYATVTFDQDVDKLAIPDITRVIDAAESIEDDNLQVSLGGQAITMAGSAETPSTEYLGILAAGIILFIVFGSLLGMVVPLVVAIAGLGAGLMSITLLSQAITLNSIAPTVAALIGLGVGIDYALFIVTRYRTGLQAGLPAEEASTRALDTSGRAVLFAGGTVVIALLGLLVLQIGPLTGMGLSAALTVMFTVLAAVTLLPALFGLLGVRLLSRKQRRKLAAGGRITRKPGFWDRWSSLVVRRKALFGIAGTLAILVLSIPTLSLRLGYGDAGNDPQGSTTRQAYDTLAEGFGPGSNGPLVLVAPLSGAADAKALKALIKTVEKTDGVASVASAPITAKSTLGVVQVVPTTAPQAEATSKLITHLRQDVIPAAERGTALNVYVGGVTAATTDFAALLTGKLALFLGIIVLLGCLLLMIAFRSVVVPLTAAAMNLLASAASFGVVVAVFQWGWGSELLGVGGAGPVEAILPVIMLAILFGLSMDYQVFLVSRMHEEWEQTHDNQRAVRIGQAETGRMITAAAMIMICVFLAFVFSGQRVIAEFGVGLASAVAIDAFILRTVLVPALMHLFGRANWWLPAWLDRILPHVTIEAAQPVATHPIATPAALPEAPTHPATSARLTTSAHLTSAHLTPAHPTTSAHPTPAHLTPAHPEAMPLPSYPTYPALTTQPPATPAQAPAATTRPMTVTPTTTPAFSTTGIPSVPQNATSLSTTLPTAQRISAPTSSTATKSTGAAFLWWFFLGLFGGHQFYLGNKGRGWLYLCTVGLGGLAWLFDLFTLPTQVRRTNTLRQATISPQLDRPTSALVTHP